MKRVMVRYKVKPDRVAENEDFIGRVFEQLRRQQPPELHYASFKLPDGVSFGHIVSFEDEDGRSPLRDLSAFRACIADLKDRCEDQPMAVDLQDVGTFRFFR